VAGVYAGAQVARGAGMPEVRWILAAITLLAVALAGARLLYLRAHPGPMWQRDAGGAAPYGGLIAGLLRSIPVLTAVQLPFWRFWDAASITMLTGLIFTRIGCAMNGCCAGRPRVDRWAFCCPIVAATCGGDIRRNCSRPPGEAPCSPVW
jgi:prolipoprotein diacylglyceryltransferase